MTKIRKQKKRKKYRYNVNRKRMNKKRLPSLKCQIIKEAWNFRTSSQKNFNKMGIVFDVNKDIKDYNKEDSTVVTKKIAEVESAPVVKELVKEVKARKVKNYKLPKNVVQFLTYMMDKYGDDYKAMSRDKRNYLQQTWKQIRSKINTFKTIPEQYNEYLRNKELRSNETL